MRHSERLGGQYLFLDGHSLFQALL
ncbi:MAG: hypothetical protein H7A40_03365 [Chlamydiales bacterium]|nr:hypothetical protein [Chlamydiales bacterium]